MGLYVNWVAWKRMDIESIQMWVCELCPCYTGADYQILKNLRYLESFHLRPVQKFVSHPASQHSEHKIQRKTNCKGVQSAYVHVSINELSYVQREISWRWIEFFFLTHSLSISSVMLKNELAFIFNFAVLY
jgi:hypothetical protein